MATPSNHLVLNKIDIDDKELANIDLLISFANFTQNTNHHLFPLFHR